MPRVEETVTIAASPERVWEFVDDVHRVPEWVAFTDEMISVDGDPPGVGTVYRERGGVGPIRSVSEWRIVEHEPPRRQVHVGDLGIMKPRLTIAVEPEGEHARLRQTVEFEALPALRPLGALLERLVIRRQMAKGLRETIGNAKRLIEAEAQARQ